MQIKARETGNNIYTGVQAVKMLPLELVEGVRPFIKIAVRTGPKFESTRNGFLFIPYGENYETWKGRQFLTQFCFGLCRDWIDTESITKEQIKMSEFSPDELLEFIKESLSTINEVITRPSVSEKKYYGVFISDSYYKDGKTYNSSKLFVPSYRDKKEKGGCFEFPLYFPIIHWKPQDTLRDSKDEIILCEAFSAKYQHASIPEIPSETETEEPLPVEVENDIEFDPFAD